MNLMPGSTTMTSCDARPAGESRDALSSLMHGLVCFLRK